MPNIPQAISEIKSLLKDRLSTKVSVLSQHGHNEAYYPFCPPDAVAFVRTTKEVSIIATICNKYHCPIIPWGAGTSLEGHTLAIKGGVTLNFSQMNKVIQLYDQDLQVSVEPGITREELNNELRTTGLFFPVDPGANATIGGMVATRASGTTAIRYGTMKDAVLSLEIVLADGRIINTGTRAKKSSSGYDLTRLIIGSEGTLAIITKITLILQAQPEKIAAATCHFSNIESAINAVIMAIQMGIPMARIELIDALVVRAINQYSKLNLPEKPHLFMEFHGSDVSVKDQSKNMKNIIAEFGGHSFTWENKTENRNKLWKARHNAYPALKTLKPGYSILTTDICVPISKLAEAIIETEKDIKKSNIIGPILGHVGDGNYHCCLLIDPNNPETLKTAQDLAHRMVKRALDLEGTITGEHGIGIGKKKYMLQEHGEAWSIMADIKRMFDPNIILNPGKLVQID